MLPLVTTYFCPTAAGSAFKSYAKVSSSGVRSVCSGRDNVYHIGDCDGWDLQRSCKCVPSSRLSAWRFTLPESLRLGELPLKMQSCANAWDEMRLEVNQPAMGPLSQTILNAGHGMGTRFFQRQLTRQRTDVERASLHQASSRHHAATVLSDTRPMSRVRPTVCVSAHWSSLLCCVCVCSAF